MQPAPILTKNLLTTRPAAFSAAIIGSALLASSALFAATDPGNSQGTAAATPDVKIEHAPVNRERTPAGSFAPTVQKVAPSVVEVFVTGKAPQRTPMGHGGMDMDQFRRFFGNRGLPGELNPDDSATAGPGRQRGLGSGVIVSADGFILTNNHVVKDASEIRVALSDGREFPAKLIGTDPKTDVAVVKIKADNLPAVTFADSNQVAVGDVVLAVGNPFGIGQTVTQGIVSAKDRVTAGGDMDEDFIQTDAAINPGNSGGALVDVDGRLVGINTAILSHSGGFQGVGFAIPSNLAQWVMNSLVKTGRVERGFLGIGIQNLTPALAQQFKLDRINGALVTEVRPGGPAEKAGLQSGDVVQQFNGQPIKDASQLKLQVAETSPGTKATVQVVRNGEEKTLDVTLRQLSDEKVAKNNEPTAKGGKDEALAGVGVGDLDPETRAQRNIPANVQGAVVTQVSPGSPAAEAGLHPGDVITEINHQPVKNAQDAITDTEKPTGSATLVKVWTRGGSRYLTVDEGNGDVG